MGEQQPPERIIGPLTRREQLIYNLLEQFAHVAMLQEFVPDKCKDCWPQLQVLKLNAIASQIVSGDLSHKDAIKEVIKYTDGCSGSRPNPDWYDADPICPAYENEQPGGCFN